MKSFWWFKKNAIAGMARPGFNHNHWFDFSFDEAVLVGWLGQLPSESSSLADLKNHMQVYVPKILKFYDLNPKQLDRALHIFDDLADLQSTFEKLAKLKVVDEFAVSGEKIEFIPNRQQLQNEIQFLHQQGIRRIIALTEHHHHRDALAEHFDLHHFPISDMEAPGEEQVRGLAELIQLATSKQESIAVHCLAGIGRTSTMLITAHLALGSELSDLKELVARQNPSFVLTGSQADFIHSMAERFS